MATRITKDILKHPEMFSDGIPKEQVLMVEDWKESWCIRFHVRDTYKCPIIAVGNSFDGIKAAY